MTNILLLLAVLGMAVGAYAVAMPTLTRRGLRLPFASFFSESDEGEDEEAFKPVFEMKRDSEMPVAMMSTAAPGAAPEVEEVLPPVIRPADLDREEDDPTLTPILEELKAELEAPPVVAQGEATAPAIEGTEPQKPHLVLVSAQEPPAAEEAAPDPLAEPLAETTSDDMMSLFSESADAGKGPNIIREAVGDVSIDDLMAEVRALREILDKRAA